MFVLDVPLDVPPQFAPVLIAQTNQAQRGDANADRIVGVCQLIDNPANPPLSAGNVISPILSAKHYFRQLEGRSISESAQVSVLESPVHGELKDLGAGLYRYMPSSPAYVGQDRATLLVEVEGMKVKMIYFFNIMSGVPGDTEGYDPYHDKKLCPNGHRWRISFDGSDSSAETITFESPVAWTNYVSQKVNVNLTFADLPGSELGETSGNTITLDTTAAGNG